MLLENVLRFCIIEGTRTPSVKSIVNCVTNKVMIRLRIALIQSRTSKTLLAQQELVPVPGVRQSM